MTTKFLLIYRILFLSLLITISLNFSPTTSHLHSTPQAKSNLYFAVVVSGAKPIQDSLEIYFLKDFTFSKSIYNGNYLKAPLLADAKVELKVADINQLGRISLFIPELSQEPIFENQIVEPGDSVTINVLVNKSNWQICATGRGAGKYQTSIPLHDFSSMARELESKNEAKEIDTNEALQQLEILLGKSLKLIHTYRNQLTPEVNAVWETDIQSDYSRRKLSMLSSAYAEADPPDKGAWERKIRQQAKNCRTSPSETQLGLSRNYLDYEYQKTKWELVFNQNRNYKKWQYSSYNDQISFRELFSMIGSKYQGALREYLLAYSILDLSQIKLFFGGCPPDDYSSCLRETLVACKSPRLKAYIQNKMDRFGRGSAFFNFSLPNLTGDTVRLQDLKGKIILIDIWASGCTACLDFKKEIVQTIVPLLHERNDLVIISIGRLADKSKWEQSLKKNSHPAFINLYLDATSKKANLGSFYEMSYAPFILLVDKNGRMITSTLRNVDEIKNLIYELDR